MWNNIQKKNLHCNVSLSHFFRNQNVNCNRPHFRGRTQSQGFYSWYNMTFTSSEVQCYNSIVVLYGKWNSMVNKLPGNAVLSSHEKWSFLKHLTVLSINQKSLWKSKHLTVLSINQNSYWKCWHAICTSLMKSFFLFGLFLKRAKIKQCIKEQ